MGFIDPSMEGMLDTFIYETTSLLEQLDEIMLECEKTKSISPDHINQIFRIMHTTKGSAAMMGLESMSHLAHAVEDVFFIIREDPAKMNSVSEEIFDLVFQASDYLKNEIDALQGDNYTPADPSEMIAKLKNTAAVMKGEAAGTAAPQAAPAAPAAPAAASAPANDGMLRVRVFFEDGCQMENIRAFMLLSQVKDLCEKLESIPADPEKDSSLRDTIIQNGFIIKFVPSGKAEDVYHCIENALNVKSYEIIENDTPAPAEKTAEVVDTNAVHTVKVFFDDGCQMENLRAFMLLDAIKDYCDVTETIPPQPEKDAACSAKIVKEGFIIKFRCACTVKEASQSIANCLNVKSCEILDAPAAAPAAAPKAEANGAAPAAAKSTKQSLISVKQEKLDHLMELVGEIVTSESMVVSSAAAAGIENEKFSKATRELRKMTDELQDVVMSMRMVPLSGVFQKMNRIVRDMCKKLGKEADFVTVGSDTEVDKNINDSLNDPFMHMVRNSVDHGLEMPDEREKAGKPRVGKVTMTAQNAGGEIVITIEDDGQGLDTEKILKKAKKNGILTKPESEYTEKEIFGMIMLPGFSTNEAVTEYSGRGVGMDVVRKNLENIGGRVSVDSVFGKGSVFTIKIPLTLAIMDGMEVVVGTEKFVIPINSIGQTFKLSDDINVITNPDGAETILIRGECYQIVRLYERFKIKPKYDDLSKGIFVLVENEHNKAALFVDELVGEQQIVAKPFPAYLNPYDIKETGISSCTIIGDGSICLIIDSNSIISSL